MEDKLGIFGIILIVLTTLLFPHVGASLANTQDRHDEIDSLLKQLLPVSGFKGQQTVIQGPGIETVQYVGNRLSEIAEESSESRSQVVKTLMKVLEEPQSKEEFIIAHRWTMAVNVLGDLRATEAVDVLVKNLDETGQNGIIISIHYRPVARALAKIGEPAIPRLIEALSDEKPSIREKAASTLADIGQSALPKLKEALQYGDAETKGGAALALAWIGGNDAMTAIEQAIQTETDKEALPKLKDALKELRRRWGIQD